MEANYVLMKRLRYDTGCGLYDAKVSLQQSDSYTEAVELAKKRVQDKRFI